MTRVNPPLGAWMCIAALLTTLVSGAHAQGNKAAATAPKPEAIIRQLSEYYKGLKSFSVNVTTNMHMEAQGMKQDLAMEYDVAMRRPNRFLMLSKGGMMGMMGGTLVCDGARLYTHVPMLRKYTVNEAPSTLADLFGGGEGPTMAMGMGHMTFVGNLLHRNPHESIMAGVKESSHAGFEVVDGARCHHLKFSQDVMDWQAWVDAGERPLLRKFSPDMSKQFAKAGERMPQMKAMKMTMATHFRNWSVNPEIPDSRFTFTPPPDAKKVERFFGEAAVPEEHALVGKPAPDFTLPLLDGGDVRLSAHKGKHVVVLDFWATWCGPCRRALPILAKVTNAFKNKGVVFYAVNQRDDPGQIRKFLKDENLKCVVAMDKDGKVGDLYQVSGIPQSVIIGKSGEVESVHVGLMPNLEKVLKEELSALVAGKPLAKKARAEKPSLKGLKPAWSVKCPWSAVAADPAAKTIYASQAGGLCVALDGHGAKQREFRVGAGIRVLRLANLQGDAGKELAAFRSWGRSVDAYTTDGAKLWTYSEGMGVDDVWAADLDGDDTDELIIGYNGFTGVHVLGNTGKLLWKYTGIGNVWHVCAGDVNGDGKPEVVTTSAAGKVHLFSADGKKLKDISPGLYANMVRLASGQAGVILVGGSKGEGCALSALDADGNQRWSVDLATASAAHIDAAMPAGGRPWLAVAMRGGLVHVVDTAKGKIIAHANGQGMRPQVAWAADPAGGAPLLLVAARNAFRVEGKP